MAWLGEKFRGDFRLWSFGWATAPALLIRADEERLRRKDFTQRGRRKGGGKSEKDRGANRGDADGADGAEKGNGRFKVKGARLRSKSRRPLHNRLPIVGAVDIVASWGAACLRQGGPSNRHCRFLG